ncbi:peptidyl-prolyl cis-trans isomerase FKBP17-1, chloroplastic isoform X1 [Ananas comosus]|uniref:peptidylprolyl isomerase n=1 Tax=Ananas comosus TaxID=4615 RepID=A0A199V318_ANACO|nr:peptidyl-prolyl cis-trans isomerase FKBP17-1, chloroplastic isoform X1 [Ananas comosus]OAY71477.1 Peptidyl-prolyl cis-trans isomerase FKBP17-1, chloroplastic [Ananas comosus]
MGVVAAPAPALAPPPPPTPLPAPRPKPLTLGTTAARRSLLSSSSALLLSSVLLGPSSAAAAAAAPSPPPPPPPLGGFVEIPGSGGVKALELRAGSGQTPVDGDQVAIHYYGRLAAKQGWRFDSTYEHKDAMGEPVPFVFVVGSGKVISGIEEAVKSMRVGGVRRVIIPPSQGYQNTSQEPIPPNFFDRQRLFTTIFNPTRLANGEGSTLGTLIFDIELLSVRRP